MELTHPSSQRRSCEGGQLLQPGTCSPGLPPPCCTQQQQPRHQRQWWRRRLPPIAPTPHLGTCSPPQEPLSSPASPSPGLQLMKSGSYFEISFF